MTAVEKKVPDVSNLVKKSNKQQQQQQQKTDYDVFQWIFKSVK